MTPGEWVEITAPQLEAIEFEARPLDAGDVIEQPAEAEPDDEPDQAA